jgi:fatty acid desaturase
MNGPGTDIAGPPSAYRSLVLPEEMRRLCQPVTWRVVRDLGLIWLQILAATALYVAHPAPWTYGVAFALIGGGQHGLMLATHEFAHYSLFPGRRRLNDLLGTWFFAAPSGIPLRTFRQRHFKHHRTFSTADDPKTFYRHDLRGSGLLRTVLRSISGWEFVSHVLEARAQETRERAEGRPAGPGLSRELPPLAVTQCALFAGFWIVGHPWLYVTLWILPLVTLTHLLQMFRAAMEHRPPVEQQGTAPGSGYYGETPGPFVRTVRASALERLFICKLNFGFHVEHHLWPQVSYQFLPALRERLDAAGAFTDPRYAREPSYVSTIYRLWRPRGEPEGSRSGS